MIWTDIKRLMFFATSLTLSATFSHAKDISIPELVLEADCQFFASNDATEMDQENGENHQKLKQALTNAIEFAEAYQGQMVYVRLSIKASNSAGACDMYEPHLSQALPDGLALSDVDRKYGIRHLPKEIRSNENLEIWSRTLEHNGGTMAIILPDFTDLPNDSLVVTQKFSTFYIFEGLAVPHYHSGNGFDGAGFNPIQNSAPFWREVSKIRN